MARNCCRYFTVSLVPAAALILAVLFACGIILLPILYVDVIKDYVYGVVIDAGSSHTTLYVYRWQVPSQLFTQSSTGKVEEIFKCPPGHPNSTSVNSYTSDPSKVGEAFASCLNRSYLLYFSEPVVPQEQRAHTNLYLGATAGMRLVREQNKMLSDEIMNNIELALKNTSISQYNYSSSAILPGKDEARSGWVTANYLNHGHGAFRTPNQTIGALDLGGASTQISFESNATFNKEYYANESVFGAHFNLYTRSFLCYGVNEAHSRFLASLNQKNADPIPNPCMLKGSKFTIDSSSVYTTCVNSSTATRVFGHRFTPPQSQSPASTLTYTGTGNSYECQQAITGALGDFCSVKGNCNGSSVDLPPVAGAFVGFSGFYYTANFFNSSNSMFNSSTGWDMFVDKVSTFCNLTNDYAMTVPEFRNDKNLNTHCFAGQFMNLLLERGYGFTKNESRHWSVNFTNAMGGSTLGWALGYILDKSSNIPQSPYYQMHPYTVVDLVVGMVILVILCVIFITFFFLTFYACRKALNTRSGYQNI